MQGWEIFLVLGYTVLLSWVLYRFRWWSVPGIPRSWIIGGFLVKVSAAIAYGLIHAALYGWSDTFNMFESGMDLVKLLPQHPDMYLRLVFGPSGTELPAAYQSIGDGLGFWQNGASFMMVRFHAVLGFISFGSYYVHAIWMAFFTWGALLALVRVFAKTLIIWPRPLLVLMLFLPTALFFTSGLHKEGFVLIAFALILSGLHSLFHGWRWRSFLIMAIGWLLLWLVKEFYLAALIPAVATLLWTHRSSRSVPLKFAAVALVFWVGVFNIYHVIPSFNLAANIESKQEEFMALQGSSNITVPDLQPTFGGVVRNVPSAMINVIVRPFTKDIDNLQLLIYALETWLVLLVILLALLFPRSGIFQNPWWWLLIVTSLAAFLVIGLIVPNLGAIARYRSPAWLLWTAAWACAVDWHRIFGNRLKRMAPQ